MTVGSIDLIRIQAPEISRPMDTRTSGDGIPGYNFPPVVFSRREKRRRISGNPPDFFRIFDCGIWILAGVSDAMRWMIDLEGQHPIALDWAREFFSEFDTSLVAWIRVDRGRGKNHGAYGRCWYPTKRIPFYRISCQVPGGFPCEIPTRKSPLYLSADGSHPPPPPGTRLGVRVRDLRTGREWYRVVGSTRVETLDEAIVWVLAHEAFHFLRRSRQIPGRNTEIEADRFADDRLQFFRTGR